MAGVATMMLLETAGLSRRFGGLLAVDEVTLRLAPGEIRAVIGPNGAGKTTLLGMISGRIRPSAGRISFKGEDVTDLSAWQRTMRGILYTFQVTSIFQNLSCYENVALGAQRRLMTGLLSRLFLRESRVASRVTAVLERVGLAAASQQRAGSLPYGHQRLLETAMALVFEPELLILDEPTQGLTPAEINGFCTLIREVATDATVLLIEHNISVVFELASQITVMDKGAILAEGSPAEIEGHPVVQQAYLAH
jgi:branched-chain amino acid transport system ATP-binding protein